MTAAAARDGTYRWWVLGLLMGGVFMAVLDSSIVNVALPHIMSAFGVDRDRVEWVTTAYMLATAVAMPLVGWLAGKVGYRTLYITSLFLFVVGSALCALAWSFPALVTSRVLQALGGGAVQPVGVALVAELFEPHERGKALGLWYTGIIAGPTIGPTLGGYLTDNLSWRSIFAVNLPVGAVTLAATLAIMRETGKPRRAGSLDIWGFVFLSTALVSGLLALSNGQQKGWTSTYVLTNAALAFGGMVMFLAVESAVEHPLLDLGLFRRRNYSLVMILAVCRSIGLFGGVFLLPLFLERLAGYTTSDTGLWMIPGAAALAVTMPLSGRLADRHHPAWLSTTGTIITAAAMALFGWLDPVSGAGMIIGPQIVRSIGLALMITPLQTAAINAVPRAEVATASSFLAISQRLGGAFGIAALNSYITSCAHRHAVTLGAEMAPQSLRFAHATASADRIATRRAVGGAVLDAARPALLAVQTTLRRATVLAYQDGFLFTALATAFGVPLCAMIQRRSRTEPQSTRPAAVADEPSRDAQPAEATSR